MTTKNIIARIIIIGVILAGIAYFLRGCGNKPGPDHSSDKNSVDSTIKKAIRDTLAWNAFRDSAFKIISVLQKGKDSLSGIIKEYKIDIRSKGADIQGLIDALNASETAKDTLRELRNCDSLKEQFVSAKGLVGAYIHANDSLASINKHILTQKDTIIGRLSGLFTEANNELFSVSRKYSTLFSDYQKINVKPKRFGIGPFLGAGLAGGKVIPTIGVGVTYWLIKF